MTNKFVYPIKEGGMFSSDVIDVYKEKLEKQESIIRKKNSTIWLLGSLLVILVWQYIILPILIRTSWW